MSKVDDAKRAIANITPYNKTTVDNAYGATCAAIKSLDAGSEEDSALAEQLITAYAEKLGPALNDLTGFCERVTRQVRQARAYQNAGNERMGAAVGLGTAQAAVERFDEAIGFMESYRKGFNAILSALNAKRDTTIKWAMLSITIKNFVEQDPTATAIANIRAARAAALSAQKPLQTATQQKSGGCYVATAVYGSYDCPEVWTLRRFRDQRLSSSLPGRLFVKCYYTVSPTVVKHFGSSRWFNNFWRSRLDRMVDRLQQKGYENTPYFDGD